MKQAASEKPDPLVRIQEEIQEVFRREEEYRQLKTKAKMDPTAENTVAPNADTVTPTADIVVADTADIALTLDNGVAPTIDDVDANGNPLTDQYINDDQHNIDNNNDQQGTSEDAKQQLTDSDDGKQDCGDDTVPAASDPSVTTSSIDEHASSTPSLASSVNSKDSFDEHHQSDDSGFSASSMTREKSTGAVPKKTDKRYIGPNCYNITPEPPQQKMVLTRTISSPHLAMPPRPFNGIAKRIMQTFYATRGKVGGSGFTGGSSPLKSYANSTSAMLNTRMNDVAKKPTGIVSSPFIDADTRPLRPGFVSAKTKIENEIKDFQSRESELKKRRKTRQSTSDLLDAVANDDKLESDSDVEHCYGPSKMRNAVSINELSDINNLSLSSAPIAERENRPPTLYRLNAFGNFGSGGIGVVTSGMRPAMSLAQLCDVDPEKAPSSCDLIAQWEMRIHKNEQK